jgi:hypothetical protein
MAKLVSILVAAGSLINDLEKKKVNVVCVGVRPRAKEIVVYVSGDKWKEVMPPKYKGYTIIVGKMTQVRPASKKRKTKS